mgnify:FL=1
MNIENHLDKTHWELTEEDWEFFKKVVEIPVETAFKKAGEKALERYEGAYRKLGGMS